MDNKTSVYLAKLPITLGQFLKIANIVQDGVEAKIHIQAGMVEVNNTVETRRGRKLAAGDDITFDGKRFVVCRRED